MTDLPAAIAAAREALAKRDELAHRGNRLRVEERANWECAQHLRVILAALDAAQPVGVIWRPDPTKPLPRPLPRAFMRPSTSPPQASPAAVPDWLPQPGEVEHVGDAGPATDDDFVDLPAAVPAGGLQDSVLNSAKFRASCYALVGIVEGIAGLGRRWASDGERLKDTREWVAFYNYVAAMRNGTAEPTSATPAPPAAAVVPADNVTPMRQPRTDLARLVESIKAAVYANGYGLSVTEAIGAIEIAKLELLKEQEQ